MEHIATNKTLSLRMKNLFIFLLYFLKVTVVKYIETDNLPSSKRSDLSSIGNVVTARGALYYRIDSIQQLQAKVDKIPNQTFDKLLALDRHEFGKQVFQNEALKDLVVLQGYFSVFFVSSMIYLSYCPVLMYSSHSLVSVLREDT